jgi:hypothetical protein
LIAALDRESHGGRQFKCVERLQKKPRGPKGEGQLFVVRLNVTARYYDHWQSDGSVAHLVQNRNSSNVWQMKIENHCGECS